MKSHSLYLVALFSLLMTGCSNINSVLEGKKVDYKSSEKLVPLDVPPDLIKPAGDERYTVPEANRGSATLSSYNTTRLEVAHQAPGVATVLPETALAHIERSGTQRWLVINRDPQTLWPLLKEFWQQAGFLLILDSPETGIMETDWAENRAKIPQDFIRSTLGKVFDSLYSTSERDKFRTRLEKTAHGTEIFISHRGMVEVYNSSSNDQTVWQPRPSDPELEAEFLRRVMLVLGADKATAHKQVANAAPIVEHATLLREGSNTTGLRLDETFDRAWRRVGLSLDRVGFTVEDRDRSQGIYFVRYIDPEIDSARSDNKKGFFSQLFSWGSSKAPEKSTQFRISITSLPADNARSMVSVETHTGQPDTSETATRILSLLYEQLK